MSRALSHSRDVHRCATERWLRYALGRAPDEDEARMIDPLTDSLMANEGDLRQLLLDIATSPTFRLRRVEAL